MANFDMMRRLARDEGGKIILLVLDGLGGLPLEATGKTELETANTPNMDKLAGAGSLGAIVPVARGISPGSGPAHLALFGYDPIQFDIGRGVLSAFGVGMDVQWNDVMARGNFATLDENGIVTDRRAGRISTEEAEKRLDVLRSIEIPGVTITLKAEKEYRFVLHVRGEGLSGHVADTDPQVTGEPMQKAVPTSEEPAAQFTADIINQWVGKAVQALKGYEPANGVLLRGVAMDPNLPKYNDVYRLKAACVAVYPMYKGVSKLVGMTVIDTYDINEPQEEFEKVAGIWGDYDFIFCHVKRPDSLGEDGNFDGKAAYIEKVDAALPTLLNLNPDVLMITGDHSTPAKLRSHSWHPVPFLLHAPATTMPSGADHFGERICYKGPLGIFPSADIMPLALAHALRLDRYGA
ncbi:MAG: 2,3-bisphosphoglycerate-independent phosphoglycerate mutase [Chloroflexi bacterium]|nr:2,3-bisphosphoglycerate-independent phosphoglycerate mutase [Chloroflexota bacterium]